MLAIQTGIEEIAISDDEGKAITVAAQNVMRHYSVEATQKTLDWISLIGATGMVYLPRVAAINMRRKANAAERPRAPRRGRVVYPPEFNAATTSPAEVDEYLEGFSEEASAELPN